MPDPEPTQGLSCPNCGGMVPIPEGQTIVVCPFCGLRAHVRGERGLRRFQTPVRVKRESLPQTLKQFLSSNMAIAADASRKAQLSEVFLAYLPFWAYWVRVMGWVFGQKKIRSGKHTRYEAREVKIVEEMTWNGAACDVGEFGVTEVPLTTQALTPFEPERLHEQGMVFEPVGSQTDARSNAAKAVEETIVKRSKLDRIAQVFTRFTRKRFGLVYYPLWVMRYLYRGRVFQVVVDGFSGQVLYGKAPGNTLYRAAMLVGGMALGAAVAVDGGALALYLATQTKGDSAATLFIGCLALFGVGFGIMGVAYRAFRYGEQYEFRSGSKKSLGGIDPGNVLSGVKDLSKWLDQSN